MQVRSLGHRAPGGDPVMGTVTAFPGIRGRAAETRVLDEALDQLTSGRSAVVLIEGEAGIGKTRLLAQTLTEASRRGLQAAAGRAEELEQARPFGLVAGVFGCVRSSPDRQRAAIGGLLVTGGARDEGSITVTSDAGLQFRVVDAFADLAEELAVSGPLVIAVDDLQWADPCSLLTLGVLTRRLAHLPVALIGCYRPYPRPPQLERLATALENQGARHLTLGPLAGQAVIRLVAETVAAEPGPGLLAEMAGAGGNPLFVAELLGALAVEGAIETSGGRAELAEVSLPPTLRLTILRRLSFLPDRTLQALRAASILGSSFSLTDLATVTARPAIELSLELTEAIRARVLEDDGAVLRFRHDLIRESIYADLPFTVRRGLHREAGRRLSAAGASALQVAEHLTRGAARGDAEAIGWLRQAARETAPRSPVGAVGLLERAVGLMDARDPSRDDLLAEQADSLMLAGRIGDAQAACRALLDRDHERSADGAVRMCLGRALVAAGRVRDGLRELEEAAGCSGLTDGQRASARAWASLAHFSLADLNGATALADQARSGAAVAGDPLTASVSTTTLALVAQARGDLRGALQLLDHAARLADQSPGRRGHRYPVQAARGHLLTELDRPAEARSSLEAGQRISEELGVRWPLARYQAFLGYERFVTGEWDDAVTELQAGAELANDLGETTSQVFAQSLLSLIALHRNDLSGARTAAAAATGQLAATGSRFRSHWAMWARALILEADGDVTAALATLAECWDGCVSRGLALDYPVLGADLVRLALGCGQRQRAREVAAAVAEVADKNEVPALTGAALRCRGLADDDPATLLAAASAYERGPRPLDLALASEDAGAALARRGQADRARPLLERALEIYHRLNAARDLARAEAVLREAGIRRGHRGPRGRPQTGWSSLTPTERTVADLVAEGLSNPQIGERLYVSRRTVQTHIAHVFAKLHFTSRAQLASELTRHLGQEQAGRAELAGSRA
jgi:DNA-binding CsgD family transcriptional regulator/tetratricopeptide (TPR) repeat protein